MATIQIMIRVSQEVAGACDAIAAWANLTAPGASATRASVATTLASRAALEHPAVREGGPRPPAEEPCPPVEVTRRPEPSDVERLRRAMGDLSPGTLDRTLGVAKGTCRNARAGGVSLAAAGGGKVLAWVETYEARAGVSS